MGHPLRGILAGASAEEQRQRPAQSNQMLLLARASLMRGGRRGGNPRRRLLCWSGCRSTISAALCPLVPSHEQCKPERSFRSL